MRDWSLGPGDPLFLTLAADSRLCTPEYTNDHIWELELGSGEPPAFTLRTTYGMRARSMRLFLRFTENGKSILDPARFATPPVLRRFYPNFLWTEFSPLENLPVSTEYWVPESNALAGRITVSNRSTATRQVRLEICAALSPLEGQSITSIQQQLVNVLAGQTGGLFPVIFMTGGPKHGPGPYPSLAMDMDLGPGATRQLTFTQAARETLAASYELARHCAARPWEAERARIEITDAASMVNIETGDGDWDAALAFSQRAAAALLFRGNGKLPYSSFVSVRQADHGFSRKGDGTDYAPSWSGQTPMESYFLAGLLPGMPRLSRELLMNFLSTQTDNGEMDAKPGIGGQRSRLLASPLMAALAWRAYQACPDPVILAEVLPKLRKFFWSWLSPAHDAQRDGIPEWDHLLQTGFEDNPVFDVWHPWSQGVDISTVHTPDLASMLYHEALSLARLDEAAARPEKDALLAAQAETLRRGVEAAWNAPGSLYAYRDRDTGLTKSGQLLVRGEAGESLFRPKTTFGSPVRLLVEIETSEHASQRPIIEIGELVTRGEIELIEGQALQWRSGGLTATSQKTYTRLGRVKVRGLGRKDIVTVRSVDLTAEDQTLLLPIWAGIPDRQRVQAILSRITQDPERFDRPFGLPALPVLPSPEAEAIGMSVHLPWNSLIGEGLLNYDLRPEAARLLSRLMKAVIQSLKQTHCFYQRYHAQHGGGIGERNALSGFAPVGLFLGCLGVMIISPNQVRLEGKNPFPGPVTLRYRGLVVVRDIEQTAVTFPNGASVTITEPAPTLVSA
jgi:hypothetical protein